MKRVPEGPWSSVLQMQCIFLEITCLMPRGIPIHAHSFIFQSDNQAAHCLIECDTSVRTMYEDAQYIVDCIHIWTAKRVNHHWAARVLTRKNI